MLIAALVFVALAVSVHFANKLAQKTSLDLNTEWKRGALDWSRAAGADTAALTMLDAMPELEFQPPYPLLTWAYGLSIAILTAFAIWQGAEPISSGLLGALLMTAAFVDMRVQLLPDILLWPAACLGAAAAVLGLTVPPAIALIGALCGAIPLALLSIGYQFLRGQDGLGQGDIKLVAIAGLWIGWQPLPWMLLCASVCAIALTLLHPKSQSHTRIAFGPALILALLFMRALTYTSV